MTGLLLKVLALLRGCCSLVAHISVFLPQYVEDVDLLTRVLLPEAGELPCSTIDRDRTTCFEETSDPLMFLGRRPRNSYDVDTKA